MRAVIPYKDVDGGLELRYAIRSLYKHCKDLEDVTIIGTCPHWFAGIHVPADYWHEKKERDIMHRVLQAPYSIFLYSNDDFFALVDFNMDSLPDYHSTDCGAAALKARDPSYRSMYENCPAHWLNYDVHAPMVMERDLFQDRYRAMTDLQPIKTMYLQGMPTNQSRYFTDAKIKGEHSRAELNFHISGRDFFSTHNSAVDETLIQFLNDLYPNASPCEKR